MTRRALVSVVNGCAEVDALPEGVEVLVTDYDAGDGGELARTLWTRRADGRCVSEALPDDPPDADDRGRHE